MKVAFHTLGCKVNSYETEAVMEKFIAKGYEIVDYDGFSDVYVVNTCMVTNSGEKKSKQIIRRPITHNESAIIIVMGCLSQLKGDEILEIEGVKVVLGTKNREFIVEYLESYLKHKKPINMVTPLETKETYDALSINDYHKQKRAFLKIQDGCNNFCTYCIIPYTRGRIRSKTKEVILNEVKQLVEHGHIEVVLTGIHTGGYGADLKDYSFAQLLKDLETVEGLQRIRISSIEISELDQEILEVISSSNKIVHHLHVPLQGGTDRILKLMNRKYTTADYVKKIEEIKQYIPDVAFTTDIIVGFPSETDEDFLETYDFIKKIGYQELHVFPYSRRKGTPADRMPNQVDGKVKKDRVHRLLELSNLLMENHVKRQIGSVHQVIAEQVKDGYITGHSRDYLAIKFLGKENLLGKEVKVKILEAGSPYNLGELVE
ncbi:MAG: tRNA (N(6)-L-threonylcarbamoyladenosine(37)-C(2))-methylthiotransferase MtaB [Candidatus Izemoplasmatales bacterium]|nr:tRNA (N(6)-L-threonylcarbamoyladenosine(37)-C(2))-methylthiotransferase MtaB [Candidatus Izemoplasmatales bacterium]MDD4069423.1 tRNA (N(6)-L-threonylcarbamoyladenosine(37)-C(2))-methylthiotransferase MtaB [Candidatus Izemoplasmatales bacterium]